MDGKVLCLNTAYRGPMTVSLLRTTIVCWFVTIAVAGVHRAALEKRLLARSIALQFALLSTTPTAALFRADAACAEITHGGCSCDLYAAPLEPGKIESALAKERQRLIRKGWSSSKIDRSLKQRAESAARPSKRGEAADAFRALVAELAEELDEVEVYAHFYSGNPHEEVVGLPESSSVSLRQFLDAGFPPDTVVTVRAAG